ncbi:MAG: TIGR01777 family oxidoreductase [Spirosomaceae bacterium]|nr:TIGR01777 family oxidoreductase [Spirosomataceae bacterium]
MNNQTVLITGGTGLVGSRLTELLLQKGYKVAYLSRRKENISDVKVYQWDITKGYIEDGAVESANYIIHLAGAGIADKRWSDSRKKEIIDSRIKPIDLLKEKLKKSNKLKAFVSASAIGFYGGDTGEDRIDENHVAGNDFLAECTKLWEQSADKIAESGIRTTKVRVGIVLSNQGGALPKLLQPIKLGFGAALGSGKQWMSWIHIDDLCNVFIKAIEDESMSGVYNAVAPKPVTNLEITKIAAKVLKRPFWMPNVPSFVLKLIFGEMAVVVLGGNYVLNKRLAQTDFEYIFTEVEPALQDLCLDV